MSIREHSRRLFCSIKRCGLRCYPSCLYIYVLQIMGYSHFSGLPSTIILPASVFLPICMFCSCVCMSERTTRKNTVLKIRIRSQMYPHLHVLHFILYSTFTATIYDRNYACCHYIRHMEVVRSIGRPIHRIARPRASAFIIH